MQSTFLLLFLSFSFSIAASAQVETKTVIMRNSAPGSVEEFQVLKADKNVRHGPYTRYQQNVFAGGVIICESGEYVQGEKEGEWLTFSQQRPWNKLVSKGTYHAGQPDGWWTYYHLLSSASTTVAQTAVLKTGVKVSINDTTAVVQAQGQYALGKRIGIWTYYDRQGQVMQKIDHFSNQLLTWRQAEGVEITGSAANTHPVLYVGGKRQLEAEIYCRLHQSVTNIVSSGKENVAEFVFNIDAAGQLIGIALVGTEVSNRYTKALLAILTAVPATWLPQSVGGRFQAGDYRIRVTAKAETIQDRRGVWTKVEALGE